MRKVEMRALEAMGLNQNVVGMAQCAAQQQDGDLHGAAGAFIRALRDLDRAFRLGAPTKVLRTRYEALKRAYDQEASGFSPEDLEWAQFKLQGAYLDVARAVDQEEMYRHFYEGEVADHAVAERAYGW